MEPIVGEVHRPVKPPCTWRERIPGPHSSGTHGRARRPVIWLSWAVNQGEAEAAGHTGETGTMGTCARSVSLRSEWESDHMSQTGAAALQDGLAHIAGSPRKEGKVELIVCRPTVDGREVVASARVEPGLGLEGDSWRSRPHPSSDAEITLMNARCVAILAGDVDRWPLAGDQLYVDMDLSLANLPAGSRLRAGAVLLEVSDKPHTGCSKFSARFGEEALAFVNSAEGKAMRLRGMNCRVIEGGVVRAGDPIAKE